MPALAVMLGLDGGIFPWPMGTPSAPEHVCKATMSHGKCCFFASFFLLKQIHMPSLCSPEHSGI